MSPFITRLHCEELFISATKLLYLNLVLGLCVISLILMEKLRCLRLESTHCRFFYYHNPDGASRSIKRYCTRITMLIFTTEQLQSKCCWLNFQNLHSPYVQVVKMHWIDEVSCVPGPTIVFTAMIWHSNTIWSKGLLSNMCTMKKCVIKNFCRFAYLSCCLVLHN